MTLPAGDRHCDVILPRIQKRHVLEESNDLEPRVSLLEADDLDDEEEEDDEEDEDEEGMEEGEHRGSSRGDTLDCKSVLSFNRSFHSRYVTLHCQVCLSLRKHVSTLRHALILP